MDFVLVFDRLFPGENVHPRVCEKGITYADLANDKWRGSGLIPSLADCQAAWSAILAERPELSLPLDLQKVALAKQAAKQPDSSPQGRRDRAAYRVLLRACAKHNSLVALLAAKGTLTVAGAASVRLAVTTLDDFQAAVATEIDNDQT
jgi:hypothetical protein